jgi:hypothetical protein
MGALCCISLQTLQYLPQAAKALPRLHFCTSLFIRLLDAGHTDPRYIMSRSASFCIPAPAAAESQRCRVFSPSFTSSNFRAAYNPWNVALNGDNMSMRMNGLDGGTRVEPNYARQVYGQFQVRAQVPCENGVVSAFYVSCSGQHYKFGVHAMTGMLSMPHGLTTIPCTEPSSGLCFTGCDSHKPPSTRHPQQALLATSVAWNCLGSASIWRPPRSCPTSL